jgi:hypothetical protein
MLYYAPPPIEHFDEPAVNPDDFVMYTLQCNAGDIEFRAFS